MRLNKLAWALVAVSASWAASANPAINNNVNGSIAGSTATTTQIVANQARQVRIDGGMSGNLGGSSARTGSQPGASGMEDSRGWLMALVTVLLIGHQLRRKHRFLRPQRFSDL
jgi:hypothetical protein